MAQLNPTWPSVEDLAGNLDDLTPDAETLQSSAHVGAINRALGCQPSLSVLRSP